MKAIFNLNCDCGRMGNLEGLFTANISDVENIIGKHIYFGEVLGKHSDINGVLEKSDIEMLSDDQKFIEKFETIMGSGTISGINPFDYYEGENEEEYE
ncbi:hypothetical protein CJF42_26265 [Pseudoalteromonas sp. NBT06-2]|uniref:hypothetical protein n=1 Tax=Pseudoalteromonas sp. NBT06-2 TaxID=2025950 RepID=UPI000BA52513|nr:hypothetical protein [Pseudoalteromonas sp. NBT06-2]PAJ68663.1 hypothetical protein CJF42_26265 [Pseudoalteromonas sp. NBT06-2]